MACWPSMVLGVATGPSEAEVFWTEFLRSLADRGLRGVQLVIADDHKGLRAAARRVFDAGLQRCRVPLGGLLAAAASQSDRAAYWRAMDKERPGACRGQAARSGRREPRGPHEAVLRGVGIVSLGVL